jgi:hypothetical protein
MNCEEARFKLDMAKRSLHLTKTMWYNTFGKPTLSVSEVEIMRLMYNTRRAIRILTKWTKNIQ